MDKEEYDMWLEDTLKLFNVPIDEYIWLIYTQSNYFLQKTKEICMNIDLTKTQQYLEWLKNKLYLNAIAPSAKNRIVYRGQVYRCNLGKEFIVIKQR